jgi:single-stranded DNA-binding protein
MVVGQVSCEAYKASDGSPRASLTVLANEVEFLSSRSEAPEAQEQPKPHEPMPVETPDDLPF